MYTNENFDNIYKKIKSIKSTTIQEKLKEIKKFYNEFNKKIARTTVRYNDAVKAIFDQFPIKHKIDISGQEIYIANGKTLQTEDDFLLLLNGYSERLTSIKYLEFLSEENRNVVFVGPNGCGKTTLLRKLKNDTRGAKIYYFLADRVLLVSESFTPKRSYDGFISDLQDNYNHSINYDNSNQGYYITQQFDYFINLLERERNEENEQKIIGGQSDKIIKKWNELIKERELFFRHGLCVRTLDKQEYKLKYLSSGEKSILYFLIGTLLLPENDFYFIDEPENNLNPAIVSRLWDFIEKERPNSIFVYLTHDSDFVASRLNTKTYWIEKYNGVEWSWKLLPENRDLPQQLMVQLVGNRQPVIFCESENEEKYDSLIFKIMFSEFKIVPSGGCDKVISYIKAYKVVGFPSTAYGIIDCDYKNDEYLNRLQEENIYHLPFHEIENFLVSEKILSEMIKTYCGEDEYTKKYNDAKNFIASLFVDNKDKWIVKHVAFELREKFDYRGKINSLNTLDEFKNLYNSERKTEAEIDSIAEKYGELFNEIVAKNEIDLYLRYLDYKGILNDINRVLVFQDDEKYEDKVLLLFKMPQGEVLLKSLREEYLTDIKNL